MRQQGRVNEGEERELERDENLRKNQCDRESKRDRVLFIYFALDEVDKQIDEDSRTKKTY